MNETNFKFKFVQCNKANEENKLGFTLERGAADSGSRDNVKHHWHMAEMMSDRNEGWLKKAKIEHCRV